MKKILKITNLIENVDNYSMNTSRIDIDEENNEAIELTSGSIVVAKVEGEELNKTLRKIADNDIEIFVEENSIGFGAQNGGVGQTQEEFDKAASTPESD
jgi:hypothetical protein